MSAPFASHVGPTLSEDEGGHSDEGGEDVTQTTSGNAPRNPFARSASITDSSAESSLEFAQDTSEVRSQDDGEFALPSEDSARSMVRPEGEMPPSADTRELSEPASPQGSGANLQDSNPFRTNERAIMMEMMEEHDDGEDDFSIPSLRDKPVYKASAPEAPSHAEPSTAESSEPTAASETARKLEELETALNAQDNDTEPAASEQAGASAGKKMPIGEKLVSLGLISQDQLQIVLQEQKTSKKLFGTLLVDMGFITESALGEVLAETSGVEKFDARATMLDPKLIKRLPKELAIRSKVLPVSLQNTELKLAMADIHNVLAVDQVRRHFPKNIRVIPLYSTEGEIMDLIDQYYDYEMEIDGILKEIETGIRQQDGKLEGETEGYINPTVRLVNAILIDAIKQGVSDIHFEPEGNFLRLRYRIDGVMQQVRSFHLDYWSAMAVRIKIMSGMNIAEMRNPQDGRITYNVLGREVDFRVASQPTVHGENIVLRLLDKKKGLLPIGALGFSDHNVKLLKRLLKRPEGIIIVTGPTGSGKTTSLYSILDYINNIDVNIMTLEDPVEYQLPLIRQTSVREGTGVDFVSGIKSMMRQDPDIIFVGEVRDEETAMMAVRAALTGHQVFTTLHTNDALGAIPRLVDIGIPRHMLAGSLICTVAQRLARKLCPHCKQERQATPEEARILGYEREDAPVIYDAVGCEACHHKGYKGRVALIEILRVDRGMDELIATGATRNAVMEYALEHGFVPMVQDGIDKVVLGEIDIPQLIDTVDVTDRL